jgi:hypothetical protein
MKEAVAIGVCGGGNAIALDEAPEQHEVAMGVFFGTKDAGEDLARGIVNGRVEDEARSAVFQPKVMTAVHLNEKAGLRHAIAASAVAWGTAFTRSADAGGAEPALDRWAGEAELLTLGDEFGEMAVVAAGIGRAGEGQQTLAHSVGEASWGRVATVAMGQGGQPMLADLGEKAAQVSSRQAQDWGGIQTVRRPSRTWMRTWARCCSRLLKVTLPLFMVPGVIESLSSYGMTESLSNYISASFD